MVDDIPVLGARTGEVSGSGEELRDLVASAKKNLEEAVRAYMRRADAPPLLGEKILGMARAGWQFLLPISEKACVLDLGCGWGGLAYSLTRTNGQVVAMDDALEKLQLLRIRTERDEIENLQLVCSGRGQYLPFRDQTFDIVVFNGASKKILSNVPGSPRHRHEQVLAEIYRVLKPRGALYLAVENRYGWRMWLRQLDGGPGYRYAPGLARWFAHVYPFKWGKDRLRKHLYGKRQYRRLLKRCGLGHEKFYVPLPDYQHPASMTPAKAKKQLARQAQRVVSGRKAQAIQILKGLLVSHFPDAFGIVAQKHPVPSFLERITDHIRDVEAFEAPSTFHYRMNGEMGMVTVLYRGKTPRSAFVLKLPIHERGQAELEREVKLLEKIHSGKHGLSSLKDLCPKVLGTGMFEKQFYALFSLIPGLSGDKLSLSPDRWSDALKNGVQLALALREFGQAERTHTLRERLAELGDSVRSLAHNVQQRDVVEKAVALVAESFAGVDHPLSAFGHGDMKLANLLFDPKSLKLTGVIDWGASGGGELAGYDVQFMLVDYRRRVYKRSMAEELRTWIRGEPTEDVVESILVDYANQTGLPTSRSLWRGVAAYQWLKRLAPLAEPYETQRFNHRYLDEMFGIFE